LTPRLLRGIKVHCVLEAPCGRVSKTFLHLSVRPTHVLKFPCLVQSTLQLCRWESFSPHIHPWYYASGPNYNYRCCREISWANSPCSIRIRVATHTPAISTPATVSTPATKGTYNYIGELGMRLESSHKNPPHVTESAAVCSCATVGAEKIHCYASLLVGVQDKHAS
jgi:hypothetical protein